MSTFENEIEGDSKMSSDDEGDAQTVFRLRANVEADSDDEAVFAPVAPIAPRKPTSLRDVTSVTRLEGRRVHGAMANTLKIDNEFVHESFKTLKQWGKAVEASGKVVDNNRDSILKLYGYGATNNDFGGGVGVLWPTLSNELRFGREEMKGYFDMFAPKVIGKARWNDCVVQVLGKEKDVAVWNGNYDFPMRNEQGENNNTNARFTFVLQKISKDMLEEVEETNKWQAGDGGGAS